MDVHPRLGINLPYVEGSMAGETPRWLAAELADEWNAGLRSPEDLAPMLARVDAAGVGGSSPSGAPRSKLSGPIPELLLAPYSMTTYRGS